ncbi:MAG: glycosyltransferase family 1 protein [Patescibacteria group bacterium]|jgi:glycosyltransferase involved in cell wall biosynthesis
MNIGVDLRCLQSPYRTGVGEYAFELITAILKTDRQNQYFLFYNSLFTPTLPEFNFPNVTIAKFSFPNKLLNLSSLFFKYPKIDLLIRNKFKLSKLDYFFSPNLNFTSLSSETKHLLTIHDLTFELFPNYLTAKQLIWHRLANTRRQCEEAKIIFTPSSNTKRDLIEYFNLPAEKVKTIYPGLSSVFQKTNTSEIVKKNNLPEKFILFLGTLEPRKNITSIIRAFEMSQNSLSDKYDLVIAGAPGWKNSKIKMLSQKSILKNRIHFVGYINDSDKPELYKKSALFIYPSFYEGFGFPVLEAMASGVPVITSNRSSLPEITDGAAHLVNPHRIDEITNGIIKILSNQEYRNEMIKNGLERSKVFHNEKAAREWLSVILA